MPMSLHIALRNLLAHKTSTFIVAIIILAATGNLYQYNNVNNDNYNN